MISSKLYIVGIGYKPLDQMGKDIICSAGVIFASGRLFDIFSRYEEFGKIRDQIQVIESVDETMRLINAAQCSGSGKPIVLLAAGDPLFHGIGHRAIREFGREHIEIIPDLSCMQVGFSRIAEPWDDALFVSLHRGPDPLKQRELPYELADIASLAKMHKRIGILTDSVNTPSRIAGVLSSARILALMCVCEQLGYPDERIIRGQPDEIETMSFVEPNIVILINNSAQERKQQ
jgi:precorrin-6Y C5,15-methyltransferase (decarboxylating)